jgi:predicted signal transduction protein with EAL and GGDEF domain
VQRFSGALEGAELDFEGHKLPVNASLGLALFADDAAELGALLDFADQAMYTDKRRRKSEKMGSE